MNIKVEIIDVTCDQVCYTVCDNTMKLSEEELQRLNQTFKKAVGAELPRIPQEDWIGTTLNLAI